MTKRKENPLPSANPPVLTNAIAAFVASTGAKGASRPEIAAAIGKPMQNINNCLRIRLVPRGKLFQSGPDKRIRFFSTEADAEAYDRSIPDVMAEARAARKARQKVQQAEYLQRVKMLLVERVVDIIRSAGPEGISRQGVDDIIGTGKNHSAAISESRMRGLIVSAGPHMMCRYFVSQTHADAWAEKSAELMKDQVKANSKARMERCRTAKRASDAKRREANRKERAKDTSRRKNAFALVGGNGVPVKVHAPRPADLKTAEMVIPEGVTIQRCKPWTHDVRFQVEPGRRVLGEFTTEWRQRRSA